MTCSFLKRWLHVAIVLTVLSVGLPAQDLVMTLRPNQSELARALRSGTRLEQQRAAMMSLRMNVRDVGSELASALVDALVRENSFIEEHQSNPAKRGEALSVDAPLLQHDLAASVIRFEDTRAIPALAGALGTGMAVVEALVAFGELALPEVSGVAGDTSSAASMATDALIALRHLAESERDRASSGRSRAAAKDVAKVWLDHPKPHPSLLLRAIDVGIASGDAGVRARIRRIADDPNELIRRGVADERTLDRLRERARAQLRGEAALPRRKGT